MRSIIMAGGSGTRLWPFSRKNFPKQFLAIQSEKSLIQTTAERIALFTDPSQVYVVAGEDHRLTIVDHLSKSFRTKYDRLILEPTGRNTAPAIALTVKYMLEHEKVPETEVLFFSPSDHIIRPENEFADAVKDALPLAQNNIVTFGIVPNKPETGYGYVELGESVRGLSYAVKRFVEKPDLEKATEYLAAGNYMWNSGMFMFSVKVILEAFDHYAPELAAWIRKSSYADFLKAYPQVPAISIDYAVMEKAKNIVCRKLSIEWNDIGSWDSYFDLLPKDSDNNAFVGDVKAIDTKDSLVIANRKLTTLIGVHDIAVIETEDAILVSDRKKSQDVKEIVQILKSQKRKEADEHVTTYRPWGSYTVLEESERYKIKKIVVNVGERLSLQRHQHRSEHWIVVKGAALVEIDGKEQYIHENESAYVPKSVVHRLSNPGKIPLEMIEVQNGEYVGEDDIERLEDNYGRV